MGPHHRWSIPSSCSSPHTSEGLAQSWPSHWEQGTDAGLDGGSTGAKQPTEANRTVLEDLFHHSLEKTPELPLTPESTPGRALQQPVGVLKQGRNFQVLWAAGQAVATAGAGVPPNHGQPVTRLTNQAIPLLTEGSHPMAQTQIAQPQQGGNVDSLRAGETATALAAEGVLEPLLPRLIQLPGGSGHGGGHAVPHLGKPLGPHQVGRMARPNGHGADAMAQ